MFVWVWALGVCDQLCAAGGACRGQTGAGHEQVFNISPFGERLFWFLELTISRGWGGSRLICQVWAHLVTG